MQAPPMNQTSGQLRAMNQSCAAGFRLRAQAIRSGFQAGGVRTPTLRMKGFQAQAAKRSDESSSEPEAKSGKLHGVLAAWKLLLDVLDLKRLLAVGLIFSALSPVYFPLQALFTLRSRNLGIPRTRVEVVPKMDRSSAAAKLLEKISAREKFHVVYGAHAIGKSSLIREALQQRGHGAIYVDLNSLQADVQELALKVYTVMGCLPSAMLNFGIWWMKTVGLGEQVEFKELFRVGGLLHKLAERYRRFCGADMILVFDGANSLPREVLKALLETAEKLAHQCPSLIIVFVGKGGQLPFICSETSCSETSCSVRSSLTRGEFHMIAPAKEEELKEYVLQRFGSFPSDTVDRVLDMVDGNIPSLLWCMEELKKGVSIDKLEATYKNTYTLPRFQNAGLFDLESQGWVRALYNEIKARGGKIHAQDLEGFAGSAQLLRLSKCDLFNIDEHKFFSYESKAIERFAEEELARFKKLDEERKRRPWNFFF